MDYSRYEIRSVVDWIEIIISLQRATNSQTIRAHCPAEWCRQSPEEIVSPFFKPINGLSNGTASVFSFRVQEPASAATVQAQLARLALDLPGGLGFGHPPSITGVEVSLDAYSKAHEMAELVDMAEHFTRANKTHRIWRFSKGKRDRTDYACNIGSSEIRARLADGFASYSGKKNDPETMRAYIKTTDSAGKTALQNSQYRARIETTLLAGAVPFATIEDWQSFKFESLASEFFSFLEWKEGSPPATSVIRENLRKIKRDIATQLAWDDSDNRRATKRRAKDAEAQADSKLNERARDALRSLTARQSRPFKPA
jgi:hypothetical protein